MAEPSYAVELEGRVSERGSRGNAQLRRAPRSALSRHRAGALVGHHVVGIVQALSALCLAAQRSIERFGIAAGVATGGLAQIFLADGIADADVHGAECFRS
ncbi:hypothetical protein [Novosphingobium sp. B-7]|uniref:hypothetical protein n=1 Tax=Novosphingobium sp. B-7 TaxID=1298855 RepID=UPI00130DE0F4